MNTIVLGPLLRHVDETSATIWVETSCAGAVKILGSSARTFSVHGRHYALVVIEDLEPGTCTAYQVHLDGALVWPPMMSSLPPSVIRTASPDGPVSILVGSCRAAAPHEPPYTLELALDHEGRGVDTLWAHAQRMQAEPSESWPDLLLLVGDQVYADDSSPGAKERIEQLRGDDSDLPPEIVAGFEEYCWLYDESWSLPAERWLLSTVPSAMIFDDHDMIDDWNISAGWVSDVRTEWWWQDHVIGGLMSYWIYQHLGNLSPSQVREEGMLERLVAADDATGLLRQWAIEAGALTEVLTPIPDRYRFSYVRSLGHVTVIVIDCRNNRVLTGGERSMVAKDEWDWICAQAYQAKGHVVLATTVPVFIPDGLHDLQIWNERVCDGAWGRRLTNFGERVRRGLDLEDWSAFANSYGAFVDLVDGLRLLPEPPLSIVVASGDIHFSYAAKVPRHGSGPPVWQIVSSPIRNALIPPERSVMRTTLTSVGRALGSVLRRSVRAPKSAPGIEMAAGPFFANNMCELFYDGHSVELSIEQSKPDDQPKLTEVARLALRSDSTEDRL